MRRLFSLSVIALAFSAVATAQPTFGLKAGLNVADISNTFEDTPGVDAQPRLGLVAGALVDYPFSDQFGVRAEVLYSQKGTHAEATDIVDKSGVSGASSATIKLDYIEVPLLARYALMPTPTLEVGLMAGPAFAFNINQAVEYDGTDSGDDDFAEKFDAGIAVGAEVGSGPFFVDFRYTYGLLNVAKDLDPDEDEPKNSVFSITGAFKLGR